MRLRARRPAAAALVLLLGCSGQRGEPAIPPTTAPIAPTFAASQQHAQIATERFEAPWSLTASDGSGLQLTRIEAKAVVQGPLAFTELHLHFHNPEDRVREGTFAITLPPRAAVSRFAMENAGRWMEAEVVEKQFARRVYEDFLHRKQDPALLEKALGNQFTARVFPIAPKSDKHLVISFSQELPGERYALPLRGLPKTARVDVALQQLMPDGKLVAQTLAERNWQPDKDFVASATMSAEAIAADDLVAAQVLVTDASGAATIPDAPAAVTLLVDTSASRGLGFGGMVERLERLIGALRTARGEALPLQVIAFDQDTQAIYSGPAGGWSKQHAAALRARGAAGASDLGQALAWLGTQAPHGRVVVVTDGVFTAGQDSAALATAAKQLRGVERIDIALAGGIRDDAAATLLARAGQRAGGVLDFDGATDSLVAALSEQMLVDVPVAIQGATWSYPKVIPSARAGTRVMVYAKMPKGTQTVTAVVNGVKRAIGTAGATPALVGRAVAQAEIAELEAKLAVAAPAAQAALREAIAKQSVAARVVSSQTSMLVLESEHDYARYGIARTALADIMEVGPDGLVMRHRDATPIVEKSVMPQVAQSETKGDLKQQETVDTGVAAGSAAPSADALREVDGRVAQRIGAAPQGAMAPPPPPPPPSPSPASPAAEPMEERPAPRNFLSAEGALRMDDDRGGSGHAQAWPPPDAAAPLTGEMAVIATAIEQQRVPQALATAEAWHQREPANVLALIGLGEALEAQGDRARAARIYGSIIDLFPNRADLRRFAGERMERLGDTARTLIIDTYRKAVADRPDHLTGHRLLAYALLRGGQHAEAFAAILAGRDRDYPADRFRGGDRILADDAGLIGAAYAAAHPAKRAEIAAELTRRGLALSVTPSTRFILYWETDANDVDFHIQDAQGGHAFFSNKQLASGGELYADVTTGYGPECFAIPGTPKAGPYALSLHYYSQGPMGYGMGLLQVVRHDGKGAIAIEDRPFVIMKDHAYVDLGSVK